MDVRVKQPKTEEQRRKEYFRAKGEEYTDWDFDKDRAYRLGEIMAGSTVGVGEALKEIVIIAEQTRLANVSIETHMRRLSRDIKAMVKAMKAQK